MQDRISHGGLGRVRLLLLCAPLIAPLLGCSSRAAALHDGPIIHDRGLVDASTLDLPPPPPPDLPPPPPPDAGGPCVGPPWARINGQDVLLSSIETSTEVMASCCGPGERVVFVGSGSRRLSVEIVRFPPVEVPAEATVLDLATPPAGWNVAVRCEPSLDCGGLLTAQNAVLSGSVVYRTLAAPPRYVLDLCLTVLPKPDGSSAPNFKELRLHAKGVSVSRACVVGMDQTCNDDELISSLRGRCEQDSTCSCKTGSPLPTSGKCP